MMKNKIVFTCILVVGMLPCLQAQENVSWLLAPQFEDADFFSHGLARVKVEGKWGYIDKEGAITLKPQFLEAGNFQVNGYINPLAYVQKGKRGWIGRIHTNGYPAVKTYLPNNIRNILLCAFFDINRGNSYPVCIYPLDGVIFYHQETSGWGILRPTHEKQIQLLENTEEYTILRPSLDPLPEDFDHNPSTLDIMALSGLNTKKNSELLPFEELSLTHCKPDKITEDELLPFMGLNGKFGYMNTEKQIIIEAQFEEVQPFFEGIALVKLEEKYGYLKQPNLENTIKQPSTPLPSPSSVKSE